MYILIIWIIVNPYLLTFSRVPVFSDSLNPLDRAQCNLVQPITYLPDYRGDRNINNNIPVSSMVNTSDQSVFNPILTKNIATVSDPSTTYLPCPSNTLTTNDLIRNESHNLNNDYNHISSFNFTRSRSNLYSQQDLFENSLKFPQHPFSMKRNASICQDSIQFYQSDERYGSYISKRFKTMNDEQVILSKQPSNLPSASTSSNTRNFQGIDSFVNINGFEHKEVTNKFARDNFNFTAHQNLSSLNHDKNLSLAQPETNVNSQYFESGFSDLNDTSYNSNRNFFDRKIFEPSNDLIGPISKKAHLGLKTCVNNQNVAKSDSISCSTPKIWNYNNQGNLQIDQFKSTPAELLRSNIPFVNNYRTQPATLEALAEAAEIVQRIPDPNSHINNLVYSNTSHSRLPNVEKFGSNLSSNQTANRMVPFFERSSSQIHMEPVIVQNSFDLILPEHGSQNRINKSTESNSLKHHHIFDPTYQTLKTEESEKIALLYNNQQDILKSRTTNFESTGTADSQFYTETPQSINSERSHKNLNESFFPSIKQEMESEKLYPVRINKNPVQLAQCGSSNFLKDSITEHDKLLYDDKVSKEQAAISSVLAQSNPIINVLRSSSTEIDTSSFLQGKKSETAAFIKSEIADGPKNFNCIQNIDNSLETNNINNNKSEAKPPFMLPSHSSTFDDIIFPASFDVFPNIPKSHIIESIQAKNSFNSKSVGVQQLKQKPSLKNSKKLLNDDDPYELSFQTRLKHSLHKDENSDSSCKKTRLSPIETQKLELSTESNNSLCADQTQPVNKHSTVPQCLKSSNLIAKKPQIIQDEHKTIFNELSRNDDSEKNKEKGLQNSIEFNSLSRKTSEFIASSNGSMDHRLGKAELDNQKNSIETPSAILISNGEPETLTNNSKEDILGIKPSHTIEDDSYRNLALVVDEEPEHNFLSVNLQPQSCTFTFL